MTWLGWSLGMQGEKVRQIQAKLVGKYQWARDMGVMVTGTYDQTTADAVAELQRRTGLPITGIADWATQVRLGVVEMRPPAAPKPKAVLFSVEGHLSSMWVGPCAETGRVLESQGVCRWQPVGYDNVSLPFRNDTGVDELHRLVNNTSVLGPDEPWCMAIYSQGGIVGSRFYLEHIRPNADRAPYKNFQGCVAYGNPYRQNGVLADWVPASQRARPNTQGISDIRIDSTPPEWQEVAKRGDLYAENTADDAGEDKTAIYKIVQNEWIGGSDSIVQQLIEIGINPTVEIMAMVSAIVSGIMFALDMSPHGGYDIGPGIEHLRRQLAA